MLDRMKNDLSRKKFSLFLFVKKTLIVVGNCASVVRVPMRSRSRTQRPTLTNDASMVERTFVTQKSNQIIYFGSPNASHKMLAFNNSGNQVMLVTPKRILKNWYATKVHTKCTIVTNCHKCIQIVSSLITYKITGWL